MPSNLTFVEALKIVQSGFDMWKERHPKWFKKVDHTPIPNDLCVCIAEKLATEAAEPPAWKHSDYCPVKHVDTVAAQPADGALRLEVMELARKYIPEHEWDFYSTDLDAIFERDCQCAGHRALRALAAQEEK